MKSKVRSLALQGRAAIILLAALALAVSCSRHDDHDHDGHDDDHAGHDHAPAKAGKSELATHATHDDHDDHSHEPEPSQKTSDSGHNQAHAGHSHGARSYDDADSGPHFDEKRGLHFPPEVLQMLALQIAAAEPRPLAAGSVLTAQVFATTPRLLASAFVPEAQAATHENATFTGAKLLRIDRAPAAATRLAELVFELDAPPSHPQPQPGNFVTIAFTTPPRPALAVPRSAVLESSGGNFVYVASDGWYLRKPVSTGVLSTDYIEITSGLSAGELVVASSVKDLWLVELRLTKGGGHAH